MPSWLVWAGAAAAVLLGARLLYRMTIPSHVHRRKIPRSGAEKVLDEKIAAGKMAVTHSEEFTTINGREMYRQTWSPHGAKADAPVILWVHGMGAHGGVISHMVEDFCVLHGITLVAIDQASHGRSHGLHLHISDMDVLTRDLSWHVKEVRAQYRDRPLFVMGGSLGGHVILRYAASDSTSRDLDGIIVLSPVVAIAKSMMPPRHVTLIGEVLSYVFPELAIIGSTHGKSYADPAREAEDRSHPLAYKGKVRVATGMALRASMTKLDETASSITTPILIVHGSEDRVCSVDGSKTLYGAVGSSDKELKIFEGMHHVLFREPNGGDKIVANHLCKWIQKHS